MSVKVRPTEIPEVLLIEPTVFYDPRGHFVEIFQQEKYLSAGIRRHFVQDNFSCSIRNTLRGLHYQQKRPQAKLVTVVEGEIFDVAVDIRPNSPTFGKWVGAYLSGKDQRQLYIPEGFAHGFCVLSGTAGVLYKCSALYDPEDDRGILWSDPKLGILWPVKCPIISEKDARLPCLSVP